MWSYGLFDIVVVSLANSLTLFPYIDEISEKLDYIGINYYGQVCFINLDSALCMISGILTWQFSHLFQEVVSGAGLKLVENVEYSESGRGVYPDGLYRRLLQYHERYKHLNIPFIITKNGVSDETNLIRRPYLLEHLLAIYAAMIMALIMN